MLLVLIASNKYCLRALAHTLFSLIAVLIFGSAWPNKLSFSLKYVYRPPILVVYEEHPALQFFTILVFVFQNPAPPVIISLTCTSRVRLEDLSHSKKKLFIIIVYWVKRLQNLGIGVPQNFYFHGSLSLGRILGFFL